MWPEPSMRRSTALDAMGPNHKKALQTDYFLNIPTANGKGINPLNEYLNPALLSHFVTNMGKIMGRAHTQLTWKNQRRLGKAVRRARSMGLMPYFGDCSDPKVMEAKFRKWGMPKTGRTFDDRVSSRRG
jgi:ribosomal protein S18